MSMHRPPQSHGRFRRIGGTALLLAVATGGAAQQAPQPSHAGALVTRDPSGWLQTSTPSGTIDQGNPFFQSLGSNGRSCHSCHQQQDGWTISAADVRRRFNATAGTDPIFRPVDGANSPLADVSTLAARAAAYSMLLDHGVIRVGLPVPPNAEFRLTAVDDPYGYASAKQLSLFRRPLPATNLIWDTAVMWDGRETFTPFKPPMDAGLDIGDIRESLASQARDAVLGHEQAKLAPSDLTINEIVQFESHQFTAQYADDEAGPLNEDSGMGGADILAQQKFWVGINDALGNDPTAEAFDPKVMRLFDRWRDPDVLRRSGAWRPGRAAIARGQELFDSMPIQITGVAGLNDATGQPVIRGTCGTCHDSPNIGNHSVAAPLNIGIADASRRTPDMPLYTLTNIKTGQVVQTTDPGLAMLTGKWADIGKFKGPNLRGLAARAPYFHNGSAATLRDVVDFYDTRFHIGMTEQQKSDLVAFLSAL
ncbi:MAG: Cytochrome c peroxidase [Rhodanobacteraceae bacterium]|jgi:cytochrome c peroxidase|nr:MAG: Cytochrome c peroxidase [Rhodanobacteraceae bacterium]